MCCQLALPWTQAPIHHPPLGGCNGDLICFICPVISEPFTGVSNLLRNCQAKGEMNDKENPRQARGTPYQDGAQFCSSSGNTQPLCLQFLPPNSPHPPSPLSSTMLHVLVVYCISLVLLFTLFSLWVSGCFLSSCFLSLFSLDVSSLILKLLQISYSLSSRN